MRAYENGWNALSQAAHEQYSEAGRQPNVLYVRRGGRYYDFSGVSGLDCAEDSRAFAVTDHRWRWQPGPAVEEQARPADSRVPEPVRGGKEVRWRFACAA